MTQKLISIAAPAYNEQESLPFLCQKVEEVLESSGYAYELIICENGSDDGSRATLKKLTSQYSFLRYIALSRNFGHQGGLLAALSYCQGDVIVSMDADLQHPVELIPELLKKWEEGYQVVNTHKSNSDNSFVRKKTDALFYHLMEKLIGLPIGHGDFRLMDKKVVQSILALPEQEKFLRGLASWVGFKQTTVNYKAHRREHGKSKFSISNLLDFATQGITSFSLGPLRLMSKLGLLLFIPSFFLLLGHLTIGLVSYFNLAVIAMPSGWATLAITICLFGSLQLLSFGVIGEYIGRIYNEVKGRPSFIVEETCLGGDLSKTLGSHKSIGLKGGAS